jgi:hypothetical protein
MVPQMHKSIALGPMGNLQGTVKFYCLNTGQVLKRHSFTPLPMPNSVIQQVSTIGLKEKQRRSFRFLNRHKEPYEWTNKVPEDDLEFQGLLEADVEEAAAYPDISAKVPGVELASAEDDYPAITEEPEANFQDLAAAALDNARIDTVAWLHAARDFADATVIGIAPQNPRAALVETNKDKIVYKITFDLLDAVSHQPLNPPFLQFNQMMPVETMRPIMIRHNLAGVWLGININPNRLPPGFLLHIAPGCELPG